MKILHINKFYFPWIGGVETICKKLAENFAKNKLNKISVLCCNDRFSTEQTYINKVQVIRASTLFTAFGMPVSIKFFFLFKALSNDYDIIHIHWPFPLGIIALVLFKPKAKIIITWHSDIVRQKIFEFFLTPFITKSLDIADAIIVPTKNHVKFSRWLKKFYSKIHIIPFGIETNFYHKTSKTKAKNLKGKFQNKAIILSVGRLNYYKGIEYLLKALPLVEKEIKNFICIIIGTGPQEKTLKILTKRLNIEQYVVFLNKMSTPKLKVFFLACDIFVLPSIYQSEAFGLVQLEAMLAKKPVINTNLPSGVPLVSINTLTGLTVPPKNSLLLAEAILKLLKNKKLRANFGKQAYKRVMRFFTLKIMIEKHRYLYNKLF